MKHGRIYNFSSGPAMMPDAVLEEIQDELLNYRGTGMCVMEMSHRSEDYRSIARQTEADLRLLLSIPDEYRVLFIQGGGTLEFSMVPLNLRRTGKCVYIDTGLWSGKAADEARRFGEVIVAASSKDRGYTYIPDCSDLILPEDTDYVYICENETVNGVAWDKLPDTKGYPLIADQSSMFLSKPCNVRDYGMIWAGVQKNVGPAGMSIVIIREDLIRTDLDSRIPVYLRYDTHARTNSGYNTPNTWSVYCCGKVIRYLLENGGLEEIHRRNMRKADHLYDFLDSSALFHNRVERKYRSIMNVPFGTGDPDLDTEVASQARQNGLKSLAGHPSVGGLRASIYNAMPLEGVERLVDFLSSFEKEHTA